MKLKIEMNSKIFSREDALVHIDKLLNDLLIQNPFKFQKRTIKRTDIPNIVEVGDFASCESDKLDNPVEYGRTLLNLTFGKNYTISKI